MKPFLLAASAVGLGVMIGLALGAMLPARPGPSVAARLDLPELQAMTEMQAMVREAAIFGWRCHASGTEAECSAAVMRVIGGEP